MKKTKLQIGNHTRLSTTDQPTEAEELELKEDTLKRPQIAAVVSAIESRREALDRDAKYLLERERVVIQLNNQYHVNPVAVRNFFLRFMYPDVKRLPQIQSFINRLKDPSLRRALSGYLKFAFEFKVVFRLKAEPPHFREIIIPSADFKFHAKVVNGKLEPAGYVFNDEHFGIPFDEFFESDKVEVPAKIQQLIDLGSVKFIRVEDESGTSLLHDLERISYDPGRVTFIEHQAEQPYLLLMIGEKVSKKLLDAVSPAITEFQVKYYVRGKPGPRTNLEKMKKSFEQLKERGPLKVRATALPGGDAREDVDAKVKYMTRKKKLLG